MEMCSFAIMDKWHQYMFDRVSCPPPPGFRQIPIEQVLRTDRAMWVRLAELCVTLKRNSRGSLPIDLTLPTLVTDPQVVYRLLPVSSSAQASGAGAPTNKPNNPKVPPKRKNEVPDKPDKNAKKEPPTLPEALAGAKVLSFKGEKMCWPYNIAGKGCKNPVKKGRCRLGHHHCMKCGSPKHAFHECQQGTPTAQA